jgi:hypothetical protein
VTYRFWEASSGWLHELKRKFAGKKLAPERLKGLIRAAYLLPDKGRDALAQPGVYPRETDQGNDGASKARSMG